MNLREKVLKCFVEVSPEDQRNFDGTGLLLQLYDSTERDDRNEIIKAMGDLIETSENPRLVAQLVQFANALDLVQLYYNVERLRDSGRFIDIDYMQDAIKDYFNIRDFRMGNYPKPV